jgi:hypothetical protein
MSLFSRMSIDTSPSGSPWRSGEAYSIKEWKPRIHKTHPPEHPNLNAQTWTPQLEHPNLKTPTWKPNTNTPTCTNPSTCTNFSPHSSNKNVSSPHTFTPTPISIPSSTTSSTPTPAFTSFSLSNPAPSLNVPQLEHFSPPTGRVLIAFP